MCAYISCLIKYYWIIEKVQIPVVLIVVQFSFHIPTDMVDLSFFHSIVLLHAILMMNRC